jgi:hypothetical protein
MQKPKSSRKPFVEPALKEEASLEDVTLISGGINLHGGKPKGKGHNSSGGHGNNKNKNKPNHSNGPGRKH